MHSSYVWPHPMEKDPVFSEFSVFFKDFRESAGSAKVFLLDSFDWRLFRQGRVLLCTEGGKYTLFSMDSGEEEATLTLEGNAPVRFCSDFPESPLAALLRPVLEMRALLPRGPFLREWVRHEFYKDEKTLFTVGLWQKLQPCGGEEGEILPVCAHYNLRRQKDQPKILKKLVRHLEKMGFQPSEKDAYTLFLKAAGLSPEVRPRISFGGKTPAIEVFCAILRDLLRTMEENLPGIREDVDTEFLHDFRVAARRMRSLLVQMQTVPDAETGASLREGLKTMGQITGELRDLDVLLLAAPRFRALLPSDLKPGLEPLFKDLEEKRVKVRERMQKGVEGFTFSSTLSELGALTAAGAHPVAGPDGMRPIAKLAVENLEKGYSRVMRRGGKIRKESPDALLHALRIDCKKLRYLLEFFAPLFPKKEMKPLLVHLKALQENLGRFNDLSTQKDFFLSRLKMMEGKGDEGGLEAAAMGGLITAIEMEKEECRCEFFSLFKTFAEGSRKFRNLIGRKGKGKA